VLLERAAWNYKLLHLAFNSLVPYMHDRSAAGLPPPSPPYIYIYIYVQQRCLLHFENMLQILRSFPQTILYFGGSYNIHGA